MTYLANPWRSKGLPPQSGLAEGQITIDDHLVLKLLSQCPAHAETPLVNAQELANRLGIQSLYIKDERPRMGLGSFKALGAAFAIAKTAYEKAGESVFDPQRAKTALDGQVFVTASAGNHGLSVAAGARVFGARAVIYLAQTVPSGFAQRLRDKGAEVVIEGEDYEASMAAAAKAAQDNGWRLLSDSTWAEDTSGKDVMEGYLALSAEMVAQYEAANDAPPSHVYLQAGVGGLAAAVAASLRHHWDDSVQITVVEPTAAPALQESIRAGKPVATQGPASNMGRLDCKEPSHLALKALAQDADGFVTLEDDDVAEKIQQLEAVGLHTSPSGGAGFAGVVTDATQLGAQARVLVILSEDAADD
ncbi:pyridoxal-phosphate dependent enzyme [Neptunicoccus sediminis]|uniref:pyridoxal-phosphate dependent enzyme n=1 Tax=Neptunicoccus sediminis TaxID=1892596 RepID=UPI000845C0A5|nr:pyridoxal-phosphate dependent enzyme [Neptunicoccus sediminis]